MTQSYELMYILRPDLLEEQLQQEINKYRDFLSQYKAEDIQIKNLGKRRLAYPIKKYLDGFYIQVNYKGDGQQIAPIERAMRLSDEVIRYLTIKLKKEQLAVTESETTPLVESVKPADTPKPTVEKPADTPKPTVEKPTDTSKPTAEEPADTSKPTVEEPADTSKPTVEEPADTLISAEE